MLPCKCHIKCSIYWLLIVDIQSSLLENIQNPVLYMTDQSTIHCSSTLHNNNELSKGFAFSRMATTVILSTTWYKKWNTSAISVMAFFSNHMFEIKHYNKKSHCGTETTASYETCDRKASLPSEGYQSLLRRIHVVKENWTSWN